jgi:hypothetical protein
VDGSAATGEAEEKGGTRVRLLEKRPLSNGLVLEFWDESRRVAGDRWYVALRAIVGIPLGVELKSQGMGEGLKVIQKEVGENLCFQRLMERHFIAEGDVPKVLAELKDFFIQNSGEYLSHPEFAKRFLARKAVEVQKRISWGRDYVDKVLSELRRPYPCQGEMEGSG